MQLVAWKAWLSRLPKPAILSPLQSSAHLLTSRTIDRERRESVSVAYLGDSFEEDHWQICKSLLRAYAHANVFEVIGKLTMSQSASYSSTAGALHTPGASSYSVSRPSDVILEQRTAVSPRSTSSSTASHGHAYAPPHMQHSAYPPHSAGAAGLGAGPSADLRIAVPTSAGAQTTSWHQPTAHYASDPATGGTWDFRTYIGAAPATGLPGSAQSYPYQQRISSLTGPGAMPEHTRYSSYDGHGHPTTNA